MSERLAAAPETGAAPPAPARDVAASGDNQPVDVATPDHNQPVDVGAPGDNQPVEEETGVDLGRIGWLVTTVAFTIAVVILVLRGDLGYAGTTAIVAIAAAINLL